MAISPSQYKAYTDIQGLGNLKSMGHKAPDKALEQIAEQFEALFLQSMLKGMRKASLGDGIFDNDQSRMYRDLFDQQISIEMAQRRQAGIAEAIVRQLKSTMGEQKYTDTEKARELDQSRLFDRVQKAPMVSTLQVPKEPYQETIKGFDSPQDFITKLYPLAEKYSAELGVAPEVLLAQAALETGWGKAVIKLPNGDSTHNLFNIKADRRWEGDRATVSTLEFERGVPVRQQAAFRAYSSFEASFEDYVEFLRSSPRYQEALEQVHDRKAFVKALHDAGYATDPEYSNKINNIMRRPEFSEVALQVKNLPSEPIT